MSIAPMKRVTLCGLAQEKESVLAELQALGCLHLTPLRAIGPLESPDAAERRRAVAAWRHLDGAPRLLRLWPSKKAVDLQAVIAAALTNKERLRVARDRRDRLVRRIADLEPFGDFELPPDAALRGMKLWFYILPIRERRALDGLTLPWAIVGREPTRLLLAVIAREEPAADILPVPRVHTGSRALSALARDLETTEIEIEQAEAELAELTRNRLALALRLAEAEDEDARRAAARMTHDEPRLFAVQGWAPAEAAEELTLLASGRGLAIRIEDPGPDDQPPTLLSNPGNLEDAGALTSFYMTPAYRDWDPSLIVFASFAVFFAMILADAGYAALLAGMVCLFLHRLGAGERGRRLRQMIFIILGVAFAYGVAAGSYFGVAPTPGSLPARLAFIDVNDFATMMRVSVVIGVLHISLANAEVAWRLRGTPAGWVKLGWIAATFGGLALWLGVRTTGLALVIPGLATVVMASALIRKLERPADWLRRAADGLMSLTSLTKLFGDVLSYMRLFALGLASASLAATFNGLARDLSGMAGVGILLAILVLIFGHAVNLALGIMSGVVHGLRLNYIEFFGWGLSDEGYPFKAFARKERTS